MSKGNRGNEFALGLTFGIAATLIFILFGQQLYELGSCIAQSQYCPDANANEDGQEPEWWYWTRRLVAAEDTLAQWIMAFFTIAVVALVWRTLVATQQMARDTGAMAKDSKRIGAAQTRAYLSLSEAKFWVDASGRPQFELVVRNTGNTPSFSGTQNIAFVPSSVEIAGNSSLRDWFARRDRFIIDLGASEKTTFTTGISTPVDGDPDWMMSAVVRITYKTVIDAMTREAIFILTFTPQFDWPNEANPIECTISTLQRSDVQENGAD